jgi:Fur family ferric uptake transcriptional regulator
MVDADCAVGYAPCLTAPAGSDYEIDEAEVIYWGRCPECVAAAAVVAVDQQHTTRENGHGGMRSRPRRAAAPTKDQSSKVNQ